MLKLLKYDWKRSSNTVLSVLVVLIVAQLSVYWLAMFRGWSPVIAIGLAVILYVSAMVIMIITGCKGFIKNLRSYQRRLVPIHPFKHVMASLIFSTVIQLAVLVIAILHGLLLVPYEEIMNFFELNQLQLTNWDIAIGAASGIWGTFFITLLIFFAMTVGAAVNIKGKGGVWIGIVVFIIVSNAISLISESVFGPGMGSNNVGIIMAEADTDKLSGTVQVTHIGSGLGTFVFELAVAGLLLWLMSGPIRKKLDI